MIGILVISHEPLGTALISCTRHIYGRLPPQLAALDVIPDEDTAEASVAARQLYARISDGSGVLVLTDIYGATPSRIAAKFADPYRCVVIAGANLPMLLKAINYRKGRDLEELADLIMPAAKEAIMPITEST